MFHMWNIGMFWLCSDTSLLCLNLSTKKTKAIAILEYRTFGTRHFSVFLHALHLPWRPPGTGMCSTLTYRSFVHGILQEPGDDIASLPLLSRIKQHICNKKKVNVLLKWSFFVTEEKRVIKIKVNLKWIHIYLQNWYLPSEFQMCLYPIDSSKWQLHLTFLLLICGQQSL